VKQHKQGIVSYMTISGYFCQSQIIEYIVHVLKCACLRVNSHRQNVYIMDSNIELCISIKRTENCA